MCLSGCFRIWVGSGARWNCHSCEFVIATQSCPLSPKIDPSPVGRSVLLCLLPWHHSHRGRAGEATGPGARAGVLPLGRGIRGREEEYPRHSEFMILAAKQ